MDPGPLPAPEERRGLVARGHRLKPQLTVGRQGVTEALAAQVRQSFTNADLIKIRLAVDDRDAADRLVDEIETLVPCHAVQRIGRVALLYRRLAKDPE